MSEIGISRQSTAPIGQRRSSCLCLWRCWRIRLAFCGLLEASSNPERTPNQESTPAEDQHDSPPRNAVRTTRQEVQGSEDEPCDVNPSHASSGAGSLELVPTDLVGVSCNRRQFPDDQGHANKVRNQHNQRPAVVACRDEPEINCHT